MNKGRFLFLQKIAQTVAPTDLPTDQVNKTNTVSGSPPSFQATDFYPTIIKGFTSRNSVLINQLSELLNQALFYSSNGQINLSKMKSDNFNTGTTNVPSEVLKYLMNFSKQVFQQLYNSGQDYKQQLTPDDIKNRVDILKNSNFLNNLPTTNIAGQLATKIGGNIKTLIINLLTQIK